jgi:hypothetical protein
VALPACPPGFNPIERLWLRLKADWFDMPDAQGMWFLTTYSSGTDYLP